MKKSVVVYFGILLFILGMGRNGQAAMLTFDYDFHFSGGTGPSGPGPWLTATFDDSFGGANTVRLTMAASGLADGEFVSQWYFNFDTSLDATLLASNPVGALPVTSMNVQTGTDAFQADGDGLYDILFDFPPPPGDFDAKFTGDETVVVDLTYTSPINVDSFAWYSTPAGGHGPFLAAAQVQGGLGGGSSWIAPTEDGDNDDDPPSVPEPSSTLLSGLGLLGLGLSRWGKLMPQR